jgi:protoporphyrinogen oxidase
MSKTVIIGAGPAGLTAAYELSKRGMESIILEAEAQVGGISRTVSHEGFRFDIGGHRFFTKIPYVRQLWDEILEDQFLLRPRLSRIYYQGRYFDYPLRIGNALRNLGPREATRVAFSFTQSRLRPDAEEKTFEQWVCNRFGRRLYEVFFKTYTEKIWGMPCDEISADWAAQRIKNLSMTEVLRNAFLKNGQSRTGEIITSLIDSFHYPPLGPGMMWERCDSLLAGRGSCTLCGVKIRRVRHKHGRVLSVSGTNEEGQPVEFSAEQYISTMPLRELIGALDPPPPEEVIHAANQLRYRDYLTVVLIVKREEVFPDNWIYIHSPDVQMGRVQNYKNWSPAMVPDRSKSSLGLEYFLWENDEEWRWSDERLIERGIRESALIGLAQPSEVSGGTVLRVPKAYPVYDQQYSRHLAAVRLYLERFSNLQTIGRNGLHRYNNQDHAMMTGVIAAGNITGERKQDVWSINTEAAYHEDTRAISGKGFTRQPAGRKTVLRSAPEEIVEDSFARLDPVALGFSVGLVMAVGLFLATAVLLLKGGDVVGPNLALLTHYLPGFRVSWGGSMIGSLEAGGAGFLLGFAAAWLRNGAMRAHLILLRQRIERRREKQFLDKV